jgi:tol-pal system-associated acyl-CoA thioesterase
VKPVFTWPVRIYWEDTDAGGIVYYANYLRYMERARTEWVRSQGISQAALAADPGVLFTVVEAQVKYLAPAKLEYALVVSCEPTLEGRVSVAFRQRVYRDSLDGELLAEGSIRVACVATGSLRPRRIPDLMRIAIAGAGG